MTWLPRPFLHCALVSLTACAAATQTRPPPTRLSGSALVARDLPVLERSLRALHPGLLRYNAPEQVDAEFAALEREWSRDQSVPEAYRSLSIFLAQLRCGHTYANFFNQTEQVAAEVFGGQTRLPFHFRWLSGRMIVTANLSGAPALVPGAEVLSIDGVPAAQILARLMTVARADGSNDAKRRRLLELRGESAIETFDVFFPLFFPPSGARLRLEVVQPGGSRPQTVEVLAQTAAQRAAQAAQARPRAGPATFSLTFLDDGLALVRMPTWALYDGAWDWKSWLEETFAKLAKAHTPGVILDLRGNEGGLDVGDVVLAHLISRDLVLDGYTRKVRYRKVPAELTPFLETWDKSFLDWGQRAVDPEDGFFVLRGEEPDDAKVIHPKAPRLDARIAVLVDASNSSATFQFEQVLQERRMATLVGQPTGGNQRGLNGGAFFFLRLPYSRLEIDLPLIGRFPTRPRPDAGLSPDVAVEPTPLDLARGSDVELDAARKLLGTAPKDR